MKAVLIDDHAVFRDALTTLLAANGVEVVGGAGDARAGIAVVRDLAPDIVIVDIVLQGPSGIALARELRDAQLTPRILMLTAVEEPAFVVAALAAGVAGYALKTQSADDLLEAVRCTALGQRYLAPSIAHCAAIPPGRTSGGLFDSLSKREREVFDLATSGNSNEQIGRALFISVKTVETHRSRINRKLHVHSTVQLMRLATLHGLAPV